jgi:hypothetical protein
MTVKKEKSVAANSIISNSGITYTMANTPTITPATGQVYITNGTGGTSTQWITTGSGGGGAGSTMTNTGVVFNNTHGKQVMKIPSEKDPALEVTGKITWNGEDLNTRLERIETMLHIPTRDVKMEEKYKKLKKLWEEYHKALEEYKTWETLKDSK